MSILDDRCISEVLSYMAESNDLLEWTTVRKDMPKRIDSNLKENPKLKLVSSPCLRTYVSITKKKCVICHKAYSGRINTPFKIPGHTKCIWKLKTALGKIDSKVIVNPQKILGLIKETIPVSSYKYMGNSPTYTIIENEIPGIVSREDTLEYFIDVHRDMIDAHNSHELESKLETSKRKTLARKVAKKQKDLERRNDIEEITGMKFSTWLSGIPKPARRAVYRWESVQQCIDGTRLIEKNIGEFSDDFIYNAVRRKNLSMYFVMAHINTATKFGEDVYWTDYV